MSKRAEEEVRRSFFTFPEALEELPVSTNVFPTGFVNSKRCWRGGPSIQICEEDPSKVYVDYWSEEVLD